MDSTRFLTEATARQAARTNRILDDLLQVAISDTAAKPRVETNQIEKTSEVIITASLTFGASGGSKHASIEK